MNIVKTSAIRTYLKKKPGTVVMIQDWGFIVSGSVAIHQSLLEPDLAMAFNLTDEDMRKQVISTALKIETRSIAFTEDMPRAISTMEYPENVVPCYQTPLLFQIGDHKAPTSLHVFKSDSAPDDSRKVMLIDQADLSLLGFPGDVYNAPKNGSLPLIADATPAPKRIACAYSNETVEELAQHLGSLLSLIPRQASEHLSLAA